MTDPAETGGAETSAGFDAVSTGAYREILDQEASPVFDVERRLEEIVSTIQEFAELRFTARAKIGPDGDIIDAVAAGVNFLGEELEASYGEMERRVADRTAELALTTQEQARRALHDELTSLPNRTLFWDRLSHRMSAADRVEADFAVLFVDLDHFKEVNDSLGHAVGDQLLVDVAARILGSLRAGDSAARMGGDEFLVLLDEVDSKETAMFVAHRLHDALSEPFRIGVDLRTAMASIGVAMSSEGFKDADAMVAAAGTAMYEAKRGGRGQCILYRKSHKAGAGFLSRSAGRARRTKDSHGDPPR
jgi:diguanylate cyclase (GGDEF)-like protein